VSEPGTPHTDLDRRENLKVYAEFKKRADFSEHQKVQWQFIAVYHGFLMLGIVGLNSSFVLSC
jgi:hypothetical protein